MLNNTAQMGALGQQLRENMAQPSDATPLQPQGVDSVVSPEMANAENLKRSALLAALFGEINLPEKMAQQQSQLNAPMPSDQRPLSGMIGNAGFKRKPGNALTALSNQINPQGGVPGLEGMMNKNAQRNMGNAFASRVSRAF
jgi:hypothetical protein